MNSIITLKLKLIIDICLYRKHVIKVIWSQPKPWYTRLYLNNREHLKNIFIWFVALQGQNLFTSCFFEVEKKK